jgi:hypothetical protein
MKRILVLLAFAALCASASLAQTSAEAPKPAPVQTPQIEVSVDAAFNRFSTPQEYDLDMPGGAGSANYTVFRWLSAKMELSAEYGTREIVGGTGTYDLLAGPQFYPFHHHKITPWGDFLFGEGYYRNTIPAFGGFPSKTIAGFSFTWEGGLGLDLRFKRRWDIRPIEFDYVSSKFLVTGPNQLRQSNYRVQIGLVYKIGKH